MVKSKLKIFLKKILIYIIKDSLNITLNQSFNLRTRKRGLILQIFLDNDLIFNKDLSEDK